MILRIGRTREIFHQMGVKRVSRRALEVLDKSFERLVMDLANDLGKVYPRSLIEGADLVRMTNIEKDYKLIFRDSDKDDESISIEKIIEEEPLPGGENDD